MKLTKLAPNANFSKEWKGYMKSWTIHNAQKAKKRSSRKNISPTLTSEPKTAFINNFSLQEIKNSAFNHKFELFPCFKEVKIIN
ncbi:hypothetical protein SteCoe_9705 [Stentor coeruleus]|uniref:Uncharacterized protein n=1 Tax=Stentor coeruleus TaxID=5963 RepID=A0A1R2CHG1_9CILI|nr:hypothetical protein SteCoe_9705 [Stentor coeruleus]